MTVSPRAKSLLLFLVVVATVVTSLAFALRQLESDANRVAFSLSNQDGEVITQRDMAGRYQLVFFGFTSCQAICPTQMSKLSRAMAELDLTGHGQRVTPVFISVDPERDKPEKIAYFLRFFDNRFVGLTGTRAALAKAAASFQTYLAAASSQPTTDYQVTHSSVVYIVDPFNRIIDHISAAEGAEKIAGRLRAIL